MLWINLWILQAVIIIFKGLVDLINEVDMNSIVSRMTFWNPNCFEYNDISSHKYLYSFIHREFFSIILCVWFKKLVNEFEEFGTFLEEFGPTFAKTLLKNVIKTFIKKLCCIFYFSYFFFFFFSITNFLGKLHSVLRALPNILLE